MPFNSINYFLFLPVVYLVFLLAGDRGRWLVLLAASLVFYATLKVPYLLAVLALVAITTYLFGNWLDQAKAPNAKLALLWGGIAANVFILITMKYLPFLSENVRTLAAALSLNLQLHPVEPFVAIGVSYFVFQAMSYLIDIYLEIEKPERNFGYFALYLSFFPKLLQGPIERAGALVPQLKEKYQFNYDNMRSGMLLFAWGLFKKVVIADRLGLYVDPVYGDVHAFSGLSLLLATYAYAFQVYLDFSGYTDMALGVARLFNIDLTQNFNSPYLATSVADFWRRWHITFSRWILDYIFKPLQMRWRDWKNWGTAAALVATFLVSGVWHGASWGFVIWGGLHGLYMACSVFYKPYQKKWHKALHLEKTWALKIFQIFVTFNLTSLAWIFFRAPNLKDALYVVEHLCAGVVRSNSLHSLKDALAPFFLKGGDRGIGIIVAAFLFMTAIDLFVCRISSDHQALLLQSKYKRWFVYYSIGLWVAFFGLYTSSAGFIYLQF